MQRLAAACSLLYPSLCGNRWLRPAVSRVIIYYIITLSSGSA